MKDISNNQAQVGRVAKSLLPTIKNHSVVRRYVIPLVLVSFVLMLDLIIIRSGSAGGDGLSPSKTTRQLVSSLFSLQIEMATWKSIG